MHTKELQKQQKCISPIKIKRISLINLNIINYIQYYINMFWGMRNEKINIVDNTLSLLNLYKTAQASLQHIYSKTFYTHCCSYKLSHHKVHAAFLSISHISPFSQGIRQHIKQFFVYIYIGIRVFHNFSFFLCLRDLCK